MNDNELKEYLRKEISKLVSILFKNLKFYNIDVNKEKEQLDEWQLENYYKICTSYEENLIKIREKAIEKYGYTDDFDFLFGITAANMISELEGK